MNRVLEEIQRRKASHLKGYADYHGFENEKFEVPYIIAIRLNELNEVERIVKDCIAAVEDDGK